MLRRLARLFHVLPALPMPIALDATVVRPPLTGVHYAVKHESMALARQADAPLLCLATDEEIRTVADRHVHGAPALSCSLRRVWRRVLWQQAQLPRLLREREAGALLAMAYTAPLRCPVPYALQVHDTIALRKPQLCSRLNAWHMRTLMPRSIRNATRLIVSSPTVRQELLRLFDLPSDRVEVIPMGVDPLFLEPVEADSEAKASPYLLFVGTIEPKKGLETLLDAYAQSAERLGWRLLVAGRTGWKQAHLARRLEHWSEAGTVKRLGYVPRYRLPALMAGAKALVIPSSEEGFGLPVLEAMAMGTPVVHSDHPVLRETAGDHGLSFPINDVAALADCLVQVAESKTRREEMAAAGQAWARSHTWDRWAEAAMALLLSMR